MTAFCYRFNHFVPQAWLGCGFEIESELTILKTEHPSEWYPSFIENLGLKFAHELDGKTWGRVPGGAEPRPCFYQCGSLSCQEMVGGKCPIGDVHPRVEEAGVSHLRRGSGGVRVRVLSPV